MPPLHSQDNILGGLICICVYVRKDDSLCAISDEKAVNNSLQNNAAVVSPCQRFEKEIERTICDARGFDLSYCFQRNSVDIFSVCGFKILKNRKKTALVEFSIFDVM